MLESVDCQFKSASQPSIEPSMWGCSACKVRPYSAKRFLIIEGPLSFENILFIKEIQRGNSIKFGERPISQHTMFEMYQTWGQLINLYRWTYLSSCVLFRMSGKEQINPECEEHIGPGGVEGIPWIFNGTLNFHFRGQKSSAYPESGQQTLWHVALFRSRLEVTLWLGFTYTLI